MKTALIYHVGDDLNGEGLTRWLASFSEVVAVVAIAEPKSRLWLRTKNELKRSGLIPVVDVFLFRLFYKFFLSKKDRKWEIQTLEEIRTRYPVPSPLPPTLVTATPNSPETEAFLKEHTPDIVVARCKFLLKKRIFRIPSKGTFVMHPGICPNYRNAHGCFWALANNDTENVGMTLLKIDTGIDTGPVYGYYTCSFDSFQDSHIKIQAKTVLDNLDSLQEKFIDIYNGTATTIDTTGRPSGEWGQPWLTAYLRWKRRARRQKS